MTDLTFMFAGAAGQGMQSMSYTLGKLFSRAGYHVFIDQDLMSRIRGGQNFARMRITDVPLHGPADQVNLLVALDQLSLQANEPALVEGGVAIYDASAEDDSPEPTPEHSVRFPVPLGELATEVGRNPVMRNAVALGAVMFLTGYPLEELLEVLPDTFSGKDEDVIRVNLDCTEAGFDYARDFFKGSCPCAISLPPRTSRRLLLTGNEAVALGAINAGVRFHSGYPMSPSTSIMEYLAARGEELGIVVEQTEDEIAGINMALGAAYAGARAMTATSGGGFALMVEGLGLAGMSETPIVIVLCSRPGPATGFPTRTEQADLLFALHAGHDEFPRFIFAPGTAEQAFYATQRAFDLAWKYQVPALVLSDQFLSDSYATVDDFDLARPVDPKPADGARAPGRYARYAAPEPVDAGTAPVLEEVVCPLLVPGTPGELVITAGHEHSADGYITESAPDRTAMMQRRVGKLELMRAELGGITRVPATATADPQQLLPTELTLVCFGSTLGPVREAVERLRAEGMDVGMVHLSELAPLPVPALLAAVERSRKLLSVEQNATAQLAQLMHAETRLHVADSILKYDGRPVTAEEVVRAVKERVSGE